MKDLLTNLYYDIIIHNNKIKSYLQIEKNKELEDIQLLLQYLINKLDNIIK